MAHIHVYIELDGDRPAEASLEALGEGRRVASFLGATLYALLLCERAPSYSEEDVVAVLGRHGADKVVLIEGPELGGPPTYASHGAALAAAMQQLPPALVLFSATGSGRDLAPRLAARLGAAFLAESSVEYGPKGDLVLSRPLYHGGWRRRLSAEDIQRPVVATLSPGSYRTATGSDDAEVILVPRPAPVPSVFRELDSREDPGASLESARVIVTCGGGLSEAEAGIMRDLARAFGGELAVTREGCARGYGPPERVIGITGRAVHPQLYVVGGASGSTSHLAGVGVDAEIVAIDSDPSARIFQFASYGMVGKVSDVGPGLLAALQARDGGVGMKLVLLARRLRGGPEGQPASEAWGVCDRAAFQAALALRAPGDRLAVITAGALDRETPFLEDALERGADNAVCVTDAALETMDYYGIARVLASAIQRIGFDVVLCGDRSEDERQGAIGPAVAEWLGVPHLTGVIQPRRNGAGPGLVVTHRSAGRIRELGVPTPSVLAVAHHEVPAGTPAPGRGAGRVESVALDVLGLNAAELRHRDDCLGRTLPARNVRNATLVDGPVDLVARLRNDRLL